VRPRRFRPWSAGPSTSPLGVMAIGSNWTCTACGATNAAGTDTCRQCGSNAVTSAFEIETGQNTRRPTLSSAERVLALLVTVVAASGVGLLWVFNPPDTAWWVGAGMVAAILILVGAAKLLKGGK
jgi:hypothetical protein